MPRESGDRAFEQNATATAAARETLGAPKFMQQGHCPGQGAPPTTSQECPAKPALSVIKSELWLRTRAADGQG